MVKTSLVSQQTARQQRTTVSFGATIDRGEPVTNLIIIDNFFDDPIAIRSFALQQDFNVKKDREGYNSRQKFRRTRSFSGDSIFRDVRMKIEAALGTRTVNFESVAGEGEHMSFQLTFDLSGEFETHCVHTDQSDWGGVLYLHPNPPLGSGTDFLRHKETGMRKQCSGCAGSWEVDKFNMEQWEVVDSVSNVFNRLLLFNATSFHRSQGYFGKDEKDLEGGRLFMNFFFDIDKR